MKDIFMVNVIRINLKYIIQLFYAKSLLNTIHKQIYFYEKATLQHFEKNNYSVFIEKKNYSIIQENNRLWFQNVMN